ncbi:chaperone modulator CbpM [Rhizobium giardinii]|jgi:chaperone modulatory protein CbpM|uniref:Chaperone modulatory protein CbpM n=1 Tax=Rhizobium giardinii TaxID=56731 RepID=A0A7W8X5B5_9HYPH|nr:chaperone modulator CbpM [Rhizobium giardinii]MBB5533990.1 chaperone modulatory protein CbpM [Rhizobium giardinii]
MNELEFCLKLKIEVSVLAVWIEQGWLVPDTTGLEQQFREADVARGQLILEMTRDMGVNEAGVDLVMELVDQLHSLRGTMQDLMAAIGQQDEEAQFKILQSLDRHG